MTERRGGNQQLDPFLVELGFPEDFRHRDLESGQGLDAARHWLTVNRPMAQNHWPALSLALLAQAELLLQAENIPSSANVFLDFPPETSASSGRVVNTLNFTRTQGPSIKLRPLYNKALLVIRNRMLRNHPQNAPHATQSWGEYRELISLMYAISPGERVALARFVWEEGVLALDEMTIAQVRDRVVRPFEHVISNMATSVTGVRGGALLQGLAYGYLLADSPNLILESHNVNTGSSRAGMLGDVDGFRGSEPELAAEVKDMHLNEGTIEVQLGDFLEDIAKAPNATAIVICRDISPEAKEIIEARNVTVLTTRELAKTVSVWDLPKQQEALRGVDYYLGRVQKSQKAVEYFRNWLESRGLAIDVARPPIESDETVIEPS